MKARKEETRGKMADKTFFRKEERKEGRQAGREER